MKKTLIKRILGGFTIVALVLSLAGAIWWFAWLFPTNNCTSSSNQATLYPVEQHQWIVEWNERFFLANTADQIVVLMSNRDTKVGLILLWPRDSMRGVLLGGLKHEDSGFTFSGNEVEIEFGDQSILVDYEAGLVSCTTPGA